MFWLCVVSVLAIIGACASLWASFDDQRDLRTGQPSFETLASYTGVWDRDTFIRLLGEPDATDRLSLSANSLRRLPVTRWRRFFDNILTDVASIALSVMAPILWRQNPSYAIVCSVLGAGIQAVGYCVASILVYRSGAWRKWLQEDQN